MPVIIPPGYGQATLNFSSTFLTDGVGASVLGCRIGTGNTLLDTAQDLRAAWATHLQPAQDAAFTLDTITMVDADTGVEIIADLTGQSTGDVLPPNVTLLVDKITNQRGRRAQGRWFPPGFIFDFTVDQAGNLLAPEIMPLQDAFTGFLEAFQVGDHDIAILQNSEGISAPISPPPVVVALQVDNKVSTQRRRLR